MNFVVYALAVLSNLLVAYALPDSEAREFLKYYALVSMFLGAVIVYVFSTPIFQPALRRLGVPLALLAGACAAFPSTSQLPLVVGYTTALLLSDYYISQGSNVRLTLAYRLFLIITIAPALVNFDFLKNHLISIRLVGFMILLIISSNKSDGLRILKINNPIFYITSTHLFYFGSLALISWTADAGALKIWYVGSQIGLGLILKMVDFRIRRNSSLSPHRQNILIAFSFGIAVTLAIYRWQFIPLFSYLFSITALISVTRPQKTT